MENQNPVLVVLQLTGGNDFINTIVPYSNPHYYDARKKIVVPEDQVLPINDNIGFLRFFDHHYQSDSVFSGHFFNGNTS